MPVPLVEIVNPNGRKGHVAATSRAAQAYKRPPSAERSTAGGDLPPDAPARNASTDTWRAYALTNGLTSQQVEDMTRDDLVAHFTTTASTGS